MEKVSNRSLSLSPLLRSMTSSKSKKVKGANSCQKELHARRRHFHSSSTRTHSTRPPPPPLSDNSVRIVEVGPRDGLQNEKNAIPLATKVELIRRLSGTGLTIMEAGSFVAPKWVPQMANSAEVLHHILNENHQFNNPIAYNFLVPNMKGFENFVKAHDATRKSLSLPTPPPSPTTKTSNEPAPITSSSDPTKMGPTEQARSSHPTSDEPAPITSSFDPNHMPSAGTSHRTQSQVEARPIEISLFAAATEAFSKANTNCTIAESLQRFEPIVAAAKSRDVRVRGYVSVALGCPYEGPDVSPTKVADITRALLAMGVDEVSVADTTGMGTAPKTRDLLKAILGAGVSTNDLALHFHDTYGQALVNVVVGLEHGIRTFDSSVGGLGGCPYSKGATGNVATEDLVHCLHSLGLKTGVSLDKMAEIGGWISQQLGRTNDSRSGKAILARLSSKS